MNKIKDEGDIMRKVKCLMLSVMVLLFLMSTCLADDSINGIGLKMQYQETNQWCWIAVATSIKAFYDHNCDVTQCGTMTYIGQSINHYSLSSSAYPTFKTLAANPKMAGILADPYNKDALNVLDNNIKQEYQKTGGVGDPLKMYNLVEKTTNSITLDEIKTEMQKKHPIAIDIAWKSGGQHCVAIGGVQGNKILICDPIFGDSVMDYNSFPSSYHGGATIVAVCTTKRATEQ